MRRPPLKIQINTHTPPETIFDIDAFAQRICKLLNLKKKSIEFTLCDNILIREINKQYLDRDYDTDIISFNLGTSTAPEGDIYISCEQAKLNVKTLDHSYDDEIKHLIIHGILHLLDYQDYTDEDKKSMLKEQQRLFDLAAHEH